MVSVANAATVSTSFTAVGAGGVHSVNDKDKIDYTVSGTFVGTVELQRSYDGGQSYQVVTSKTAAATGQIAVSTPGGQPALYRFYCRAFTSGTIVTSIADVAVAVQVFTDKNGKTVATFTEAGLDITGDLAVGGTFSAVSGAGANTTLSNLGTTAINASLLPGGSVNLGAFNNPWGSAYVSALFMYSSGAVKQIEFQPTGQTSPSGLKTGPTLAGTVNGNPLTVYTASATGATNSSEINIETGNTDTGVAGNINLRAGVPSGAGTAGKVVATGQGLQLVATGTKPACAVGVRGTIFYTPGAGGVADALEVCRKDAADAYAWVALY